MVIRKLIPFFTRLYTSPHIFTSHMNTSHIPRDVVRKIISHLYKEYAITIDWFYISDYELWMCETNNTPENVRTAKRLRLVSRSFAQAYGPKYICKHIGGYFGRRQHRYVIYANTRLWFSTLRVLAAKCRVQQLMAEMNARPLDLDPLMHVGYLLWNYDAAAILANRHIFEDNPLLVYDSVFISEVINTWLRNYRVTVPLVTVPSVTTRLSTSLFDMYNFYPTLLTQVSARAVRVSSNHDLCYATYNNIELIKHDRTDREAASVFFHSDAPICVKPSPAPIIRRAVMRDRAKEAAPRSSPYYPPAQYTRNRFKPRYR